MLPYTRQDVLQDMLQETSKWASLYRIRHAIDMNVKQSQQAQNKDNKESKQPPEDDRIGLLALQLFLLEAFMAHDRRWCK